MQKIRGGLAIGGGNLTSPNRHALTRRLGHVRDAVAASSHSQSRKGRDKLPTE